ncbi:MAG: U32 family peptidase [Desulfovibrionaceae bacterium]|nr:U32 family peptidase [Desulfovibrionaceae bacterium]
MNQISASPDSPLLPELLAPAGDTACFLAALAAGADAVYVGLKHFSARAGADNFSMTELSRMVNLARSEGRRVYIAFNSLVKPGDMAAAGRLMMRMARDARPDALIVQDIGLFELARQAGYQGQLHLSTLANVTHPKALEAARALGASRVILPRELSIDEIRQTAAAAPDGLDLELFIHGALCWCVSGRCYWSSYLGGKSGLRGRCVQPCRRVYRQKGREGRFFSCRDLSLDVLIKTLLDIPKLRCLKIEGRKKGPHYVYHSVAAYRLLLDGLKDGSLDARARKDAEALLDMALGRPRTHALFLPQREHAVSTPDEPASSGLLIGKIQFSQAERGQARPFIRPHLPLLPRDLVRIGYEDEAWHDTVPVTRHTPKAGTLPLRLARHKTPRAGTPVFLIDRREPDLAALLREWEERLAKSPAAEPREVSFEPRLSSPVRARRQPDILVRSSLPQGRETRGGRMSLIGLWMSPNTVRAVSRTVLPHVSWWLPPVIWPDEEAAWLRLVSEALRGGARHFVCNAPWQISLFPAQARPLPPKRQGRGASRGAEQKTGPRLSAGPFCNVSNAAAVDALARMGFADAFVSPELAAGDMLALPGQSCLPLGVVTEGWWPVGISRHRLEQIKTNEPFVSPKGENFWARAYGRNLWIYPGWPLDITAHRPELESAGYAFFARLDEKLPPSLPQPRRSSDFNWQGSLL